MPFSKKFLWIINVTGEENFLNNHDLSHLVHDFLLKISQEKNYVISTTENGWRKKWRIPHVYMHAENKV